MQRGDAGVPVYPEDPTDAATTVLPRLEREPESGDPAEWTTVVFPRVEGEEGSAPSSGSTGSVIGPKVAVGAVVAAGLVASQVAVSVAYSGQGSSAGLATMLAATSSSMSSSMSTTMLPVPSQPDPGINQRDTDQLHRGDELAMQAAFAHAATAQAVTVDAAFLRAAAQREAMVLRGGGTLDDWISVALWKLRLDQAWAPAVKRIILEESRGNPRAVNRWDSNAVAGHPSQGLMQLVPQTYLRYVLPEYSRRSITDPVANITAGIRYMLSNYGYLTLSRGGRYNALGEYVGY